MPAMRYKHLGPQKGPAGAYRCEPGHTIQAADVVAIVDGKGDAVAYCVDPGIAARLVAAYNFWVTVQAGKRLRKALDDDTRAANDAGGRW